MDKSLILNLDDIFPFDCHKGLSCFTRCCRDINLFLTPYDILRLKNHLLLSSRDFLDTYTTAIYVEEVGHPLVVLNMAGGDKHCPFSTSEGCLVYTDRPWSCRIFPLELQDSKDINPREISPAYSVLNRPFCQGFTENGTLTVRKWVQAQGTATYEKINALWAKLTLSEKFPAQGLSQNEIRMFFIASYSLDEFAELVSRQSFLDTYNLKNEDIKLILNDELSLFSFACRWLRLTLLGEEIPLICEEEILDRNNNQAIS